MSTVFGSSDERVLLILLPAERNNLSHGAEVAGMHRTVLTKMQFSDIDIKFPRCSDQLIQQRFSPFCIVVLYQRCF